jgi:alpha-1,4-digalacturonate transport system substrate-binding protein
MPGGAAMVAFRHTRHPSAVARVMSYMASEPVLREFYGRALQIPAHRALAGAIDYPPETPRHARAALLAFGANYAAISPAAHRLQAYSRNHIIFNAIAEHVTTVINGRATMEDALTRIEAEIRRGTR